MSSILDGLFGQKSRTEADLRKAMEQLAKIAGQEPLASSETFKRVVRGQSLAQALGIRPEVLETLNCLALQKVEAGHYAEAREIYFALGQLDPLDERFPYGMGTTLQLEGNYAGAVKLYQFYIAFAADEPAGYLRIAECLLGAGEIDDAAEFFEFGLGLAEEREEADIARYARHMLEKCKRDPSKPVQ